MTLVSLLQALQASGFTPDAEEVLDALWLAQLDREITTYPAADKPMPAGAPTGTAQSVSGKTIDRQPPVQSKTVDEKSQTVESDRQSDDSAVYPAADWGETADTIKASPVAVPAGQALPGRLAYTRAMRPFARRFASRHERELDEVRTVEMTAERNGQLYPVFRPLAEHWFDADVVLEDDPAILVWQDTMREFCQMLRDTGAFRDVRRWRMRVDVRAQLEGPQGARVPATMLTGGGARRLVFFATHGSSKYWTDGSYGRLFDGWTRACSVAILQLQPPHRWSGAALGEPAGICSALEPGVPTARLQTVLDWWSMASLHEGEALVPVPMVALNAAALGDFASMQMARGKRCPVAALDACATPDGAAASVPEKRDAVRTLAFLQEKSPEAYRLAVYLCAGAFTLPVARLVQETMFGATADPGHLADVLLSGLVAGSSKHPDSDDPNQVYYLFREDARAILIRSLRERDVDEMVRSLQDAVSRHIQEIYGKPVTFQGLVADGNGNFPLPVWAQPFARLGVSLLGLPGRGKTPQQLVDEFRARTAPQIVGRVARFAVVTRGRSFPEESLFEAVERSGLVRRNPDGSSRFIDGVTEILEKLISERGLLDTHIVWANDHPEGGGPERARLVEMGAGVFQTRAGTIVELGVEDFDCVVLVVSSGERERVLEWLPRLISPGGPALIVYSQHYDPADLTAFLQAGAYFYSADAAELIDKVEEAILLRDAPNRTAQARYRRLQSALLAIGFPAIAEHLPPAEMAEEILALTPDRYQGFLNCRTVIQACANSSIIQLILVRGSELQVIEEALDPNRHSYTVASWNTPAGIAIRTGQRYSASSVFDEPGSVAGQTTKSELVLPLLTASGTVLGAINIVTFSPEPPSKEDADWLEQFCGTIARAIAAVQTPQMIVPTEPALALQIIRQLREIHGIQVLPDIAPREQRRLGVILWIARRSDAMKSRQVQSILAERDGWQIPLVFDEPSAVSDLHGRQPVNFRGRHHAGLAELANLLQRGGVSGMRVETAAPDDPGIAAQKAAELRKQWHPLDDFGSRGELTPCTFTVKSNYRTKGSRRWQTWGDVLVTLDNPPTIDYIYLLPSQQAPRQFRDPIVLSRDKSALARKKRLTEEFVSKSRRKTISGYRFLKRMSDGGERMHVYAADYDLYLRGESRRDSASPAPVVPYTDYPLTSIIAAESLTFQDDPNERYGPYLITRGTHTLTLPPSFRMGLHPVTNQLFLEFIASGGYEDADLWDGRSRGRFVTMDGKTHGPSTWPSGDRFPSQEAEHPVAGVSYREATAFTRWLQRERPTDEWQWCLPTEDMWELAARSTAGNIYPWGSEFYRERCNSEEGGLRDTSKVGRFARGKSVYGCEDMAGNVWEFVDSTPSTPNSNACVLMGGSYKNNRNEIKSYLRLVNVSLGHRPPDFGFRCAQVPVQGLSPASADAPE